MRLYKPLTKPDGRVPRSGKRHTNPYYGQRGADWVKNANASLFNAQHEHSHTKLHLQHRLSQVTRNVVFVILAVIGMVVGGFIIYSLALSL